MLGVDVGGTFTDVVRVRDGKITVTKVPSDVVEPQRAVIEGAARLGIDGSAVFNHASTHGLNAVITRRLPKVAFLTTDGHRDMLDAGRSWRPLSAQTDAGWRRPFGDAARPLIPRYLRRGIEERIRADGSVLIELDETQARTQLEVLRRCQVEGVAICLLNAYVNAAHERRLRELAQEVLGDIPVVISSETSPLAKEYMRASTTVVDVLMKLIYAEYAPSLNSGLRELGYEGRINFADCAATLVPWERALDQAFRIVVAGPAAGTLSCARFGDLIGDENLICCDVGGTSTDISLVVGGKPFVNNTFELEHDLVINALSIELSAVGAGGGSIVAITPSGDVAVGPASAGSDPGPACYGRGGSAPTLTDACLLMGILDPDGFAAGEMRLDSGLAQAAFERLDSTLDWQQIVSFTFRIAASNVAEEITNVAIRHGVDTRDYSIVAYGAAGPMLVPSTLEMLQARRVIVPPHAGLFSALGLLSTDQVFAQSRSAYVVLTDEIAEQIDVVFSEMEAAVCKNLDPDDIDRATIRRSFDGRLLGQTWETPFVRVPDGTITAPAVREMTELFHQEYERRFGHRFDHLPVQGVTYRVELIVPADKVGYEKVESGDGTPTPAGQLSLSFLAEDKVAALLYNRDALRQGDLIVGPAVIRESLSTTFVPARHQATIGGLGEIVIEREAP